MSKINYEDYLEEDPFHPCLHCGSTEWTYEDGMPVCLECGELLEAPQPTRKHKGKTTHKVKDQDWQ